MLSTMVLFPVSVVSSIWYFRYVTKRFNQIEEVESKMTTTIQENVNGIRVVKAFNTEIDEIAKFDKQSKSYRDEWKGFNKVSAIVGDFLIFQLIFLILLL